MLFGDSDEISDWQVSENVAENPAHHFEIDPRALFAALRAERAGGAKILGYWHSHPSGNVRPSPLDTQSAKADGKLWLIVAGTDVAAWRLQAREVLDQHEITQIWHEGELIPVARYYSSGATSRDFERVPLITGDARHLRILGKCDVDMIPLIIEAGYPAIAPILDDLFDWIADPNWPVAIPLMEYLATLGEPAIAPIQRVLRGIDGDHKANCLRGVVWRFPAEFRARLARDVRNLAERPSDDDRDGEADIAARETLAAWRDPNGEGAP